MLEGEAGLGDHFKAREGEDVTDHPVEKPEGCWVCGSAGRSKLETEMQT